MISSPSVLVIEDEQSLRQAIVKELTENEMPVIEAANGQEGLAIATQHRPGIIVLDLMMPVMDGVQTLKALRSYDDPWAKTVKVLILTNQPSGTSPSSIDLLDLGPVYYFVKVNTSLDSLVEKIKELQLL